MTGLFILSIISFFSYYMIFSISDSESREIALRVIKEKYSHMCGGNFEKYLTVRIDWYHSKYEYYADNGTCNIFIDIDKFGSYESWIMPND